MCRFSYEQAPINIFQIPDRLFLNVEIFESYYKISIAWTLRNSQGNFKQNKKPLSKIDYDNLISFVSSFPLTSQAFRHDFEQFIRLITLKSDI